MENEDLTSIEIICKTAKEFLTAIRPESDKWQSFLGSDKWIYRGQGDRNYKLIPKVLREDLLINPIFKDQNNRNGFSERTFENQIFIERNLVFEFVKHANLANLPLPNTGYFLNYTAHSSESKFGKPWPEHAILELLAMAQHHKVPTRLLDFTTSSSIAAFFAAWSGYQDVRTGKRNENDPEQMFSVWGINHFNYLLERELPIISASRYMNKYLSVQHGLFILDTKINANFKDKPEKVVPIENRVCDILDHCSAPHFERSAVSYTELIKKISVPIREAYKVLQFLAAENVSYITIYPEYDNIMDHIDFYSDFKVNSEP